MRKAGWEEGLWLVQQEESEISPSTKVYPGRLHGPYQPDPGCLFRCCQPRHIKSCSLRSDITIFFLERKSSMLHHITIWKIRLNAFVVQSSLHDRFPSTGKGFIFNITAPSSSLPFSSCLYQRFTGHPLGLWFVVKRCVLFLPFLRQSIFIDCIALTISVRFGFLVFSSIYTMYLIRNSFSFPIYQRHHILQLIFPKPSLFYSISTTHKQPIGVLASGRESDASLTLRDL